MLADRLSLINPQAQLEVVPRFYDAATSELILSRQPRPDFVIDAIDNITAKCHLIAACKERALPLVSSTGAAGRCDPTALRIGDLAETRIDPNQLTPEEQMARFERELKETDWAHQPC